MSSSEENPEAFSPSPPVESLHRCHPNRGKGERERALRGSQVEAATHPRIRGRPLQSAEFRSREFGDWRGERSLVPWRRVVEGAHALLLSLSRSLYGTLAQLPPCQLLAATLVVEGELSTLLFAVDIVSKESLL